MFGWEFPPHIAGGLGTACYGMTRGLARNGVEVVFVMPRAYGDEDQRFVRVVNASDVETIGTRDHEFSEELLEKVSFIHIDSNMLPYILRRSMPPTTTSSFAAAGHTSGLTYGNSATPSPENTAPT